MAIMLIADILEYRVVSSQGDQMALNVRHLVVDVISGLPTTQQAVDALEAVISTPYKPLLSAQSTFRGVDLRVVFPIPTVADIATFNQGIGGVVGEDLPKQAGGVISLRSATPGRTGRGRMYIPFPGEADNENPGRPIATYVTRLATLGTSVSAPLVVDDMLGNSATLSAVILNGPPAAPGNFKRVTNTIARTFWGTQRRRGDFGAKNIPPF